MGTSFSCPQGQFNITGGTTLGDQSGTYAVALPLTNTGFFSNNTISGGYFTNQDIGVIFQTKFYNVFFVETLLCDYPPSTNLATYYYNTQAGGLDINNWFALFNSLYCNLNTYNQALANMTTAAGVRTTNNFTTASALYGASTTYPPFTYSWSLIPTYNNTATPINPNTTILNPTSVACKFSQAVGSGYTNQQAQCKITDTRGWIGYSRPVLLRFLN